MAPSDYDKFLEGLARKRAPALARAEQMLAEGRYDDAENEIRAVDSSIYGALAIAKMYRERLQKLAEEDPDDKGNPRIKEVFRRALLSAQGAYPETHTEIEADSNAAGRAEDRAELVRILGFDPDEG